MAADRADQPSQASSAALVAALYMARVAVVRVADAEQLAQVTRGKLAATQELQRLERARAAVLLAEHQQRRVRLARLARRVMTAGLVWAAVAVVLLGRFLVLAVTAALVDFLVAAAADRALEARPIIQALVGLVLTAPFMSGQSYDQSSHFRCG